MNDILYLFLDIFVIIYIDDIIIYSWSKIEHKEYLHIILKILHKYKLYVKKSKCQFRQSEIDFLGHHIMAQGVAMDGKKI